MVGIPIYGIVVGVQLTSLTVALPANPTMTAGEMLARVLTTFWSLGLGGSIPLLSGIEFGMQYQDSMGNGKRGPSDKITSGFREQSLQGCYRADSVEPVFDAHSSRYIDFLDEVLNRAPHFQQVGYISLRYSATSKATMSMHNFPSAHAVAIEVTSLKNLSGNAVWMPLVEAIAIGQGGRPHWGQINSLDAKHVAMLFGSAVQSWKNTLGAFIGASNIFSNFYTMWRGLEPIPGVVATIMGQRAGDLTGSFLPAICLLLSDPHPAVRPPRPRPLKPGRVGPP